jgi:hypothetical protein
MKKTLTNISAKLNSLFSVPNAVKYQYNFIQTFLLSVSDFFLFMLRFFKEAAKPPYEFNELLK